MRGLALATAIALLAMTASIGIFAAPAFAAPGDVVTQPADDITSSNATLNGLTGPADATESSFWVSTSTPIDTSDPNTIPAGVYSSGLLGAVASTTAFDANLTDAAGLTVEPGTTYYYVAWVNTDEWTPGGEVSFSTLPNAPEVTSINPDTGETTGGDEVTITGDNFTGATGVSFGTTAAVFTVDDDQTITATSPVATSTGPVNVTVTTSGGTSATSSADEFTYEEPALLAPAISDVSVSSTTESGATITWTTDTPASSQVNYGTTTSYGSSSAYDGTPKTSHSVALTGLDEITTYEVQVASGNATATTTATTTFTTSSTASSTPLAIDDTDAVDTSGIANGEWADGWEWLITFTVPDNETQFQMQFTDFSSNGDSFAAGSNIRYFTSQSDTATSSDSAVVIDDANEYGDVITLTGDADAGTPGRQVEVSVQVKIPLGTPEGSYSTTFQARTDTL
jgi:hypothetical protein